MSTDPTATPGTPRRNPPAPRRAGLAELHAASPVIAAIAGVVLYLVAGFANLAAGAGTEAPRRRQGAVRRRLPVRLHLLVQPAARWHGPAHDRLPREDVVGLAADAAVRGRHPHVAALVLLFDPAGIAVFASRIGILTVLVDSQPEHGPSAGATDATRGCPTAEQTQAATRRSARRPGT